MQQTAYARAYERQTRKKGVESSVKRSRTLVDIVKEFLRNLTVFLFNQVGVCVLLISYNVIGAFSFSALEGKYGDASVEDAAELALNLTITTLWNSTLHRNILEEELWRADAHKAVLTYQSTLVPLIRFKNYRGVRPTDAWTIPGSLMYCLSIYTTIGYGNLTPRTEAGKVATMLYALLGMPLMLLYMSNLGEILANIFKFLYFTICSCGLGNIPTDGPSNAIYLLRTSSHEQTSSNPRSSKTKRKRARLRSEERPPKESIPIFWCLVVMSLFVLLGGLLFSNWEGWTLLDGCYFCYISLSTVGFGDLVPGKVLTDDDGDLTDVEIIQVLATIYLLVGMALVAMCFNLMQEGAIKNIKFFWRRLGCLRGRGAQQIQEIKKHFISSPNLPERENGSLPTLSSAVAMSDIKTTEVTRPKEHRKIYDTNKDIQYKKKQSVR